MLKVLIADDEVKVSQLILHLIRWEDYGMEVIGSVNDGEEAYEVILRERPDIVITDIRMPGMDGIELVEKVTRKLDHLFFVIVSGYSQFEYAQQAVKLGVEDYLLKPIKKKELEAVLNKILSKHSAARDSLEEKEELRSRLQMTQERVKNNFLQELLDSHDRSILGMEREEIERVFGCDFPAPCFTHVIVHLFSNTVTEDNEEYGFLLPKIQKKLKERLEGCCAEMMSIIHDEEVVCLVNSWDGRQEELVRRLGKLAIDIGSVRAIYPEFRLIAGVGETVSELSAYGDSMAGARDAVRCRFGGAANVVLAGTGRKKEGRAEVSELMTSSDKKELLTAIELIDVGAFRETMDRLKGKFREHLQEGRLIYLGYKELADTFVFGVRNYFGSQADIDVKSLMKGYSHLFDFDAVFDWLSEVCRDALTRYEEELRSQEDKPIRMAKQYINQNYNKALSLEGVSSYIGFNPAYFSSMFKKATGQNFMDYVIGVRIESAKNLLARTDMEVADVAAEVGYTDLKYFSRVFKRMTNLTPSEYRKLYG